MIKWKISYSSGYMSVVEAETLLKARVLAKELAREQDWEVSKVAEASDEDIEWAIGMGGGIIK